MSQRVRHNRISVSAGCSSVREGIDVLAAHSRDPTAPLLVAKIADYGYVDVTHRRDLVETRRCHSSVALRGLWWSENKPSRRHVQVNTVPDAWPMWTSSVRPGIEHDTIAAPDSATPCRR